METKRAVRRLAADSIFCSFEMNSLIDAGPRCQGQPLVFSDSATEAGNSKEVMRLARLPVFGERRGNSYPSPRVENEDSRAIRTHHRLKNTRPVLESEHRVTQWLSVKKFQGDRLAGSTSA